MNDGDDVTELGDGSEPLEQSIASLEAAYVHAPIGLAVLDRALRFVHVNARFAELDEVPVEAHIGKRFDDVLGPTAKPLIPQFRQMLETGDQTRACEVSDGRARTEEGHHCWYVKYAPLRGPTGEVIGLSLVVSDLTERKRMEETLRRSEAAYRAAFEIAGVGKTEVEPGTGKILRANRRFCEMLGYTRQELLERTFFDLTHGDDLAQSRYDYARLLRGEIDIYTTEKRYLRKDGTFQWALVNATAQRDVDGRPLRIYGIIQDISKRKEVEARLGEAQRRSQATLTATEIATWTWIIAEDRTIADPNLARMFGIDENTANGAPLAAYIEKIHPDDRDRVQALIERVLVKGGTYEAEYRIVHPTGTVRWVVARGYVERDLDGRPIRLPGVLLDITDRKRAEQALKGSEERVRALLDSTAEGIYELDVAGRCTFANAASVRMLRADDVGTLIGQVMDGSFGPGAHGSQVGPPQWVADVLHRGRRVHVFEDIVRRCDGSTFYGEFWAHPIERDGTVVGIVVTFLDVSERRHIQHALAEAKEAAEAANRAKDEFLANMSHEIRTPMTAILGYADVLLGHLSDTDAMSYVDTIKRNGNYLIEIINDILDLSKIEAGKLEVARERFSLVHLISDIDVLVQVRAKERGLPLSVEYRGRMPETIESDSTRLRQILVNLLGNAIKFTDRGNIRLVVDLHREREMLEFQVVDTGVGIGEDVLKRLFRPFTQADTSNARRYGGTGLGLAISRRLVEMLGGEIWVRSQIGSGSTFGFTIATGPLTGVPLVEPDRVHAHPRRAISVPTQTLTACRILVIDDRADVRNLVQSYVADAGATVDTAENGEAGVRYVEHAEHSGHSYDAVVLDMQMPVLDGYQTAARLRELGYRNPIIALTASAMKGDRDRCIAAGCTDYLSKPITRAQLIERITEHCAAKAQPRDEPAPATSTSDKILLVEDNEDALVSMTMLLELRGFSIIAASTGTEAIEVATSEAPPVILLDLGLPDMDGFEVLAQLRERGSDAYIIALTGRHEVARPPDAPKFDSYLIKPVDVDVLCDAISSALEARHGARVNPGEVIPGPPKPGQANPSARPT